MNFYLIYGLENYLINKKIDEIMKKINVSNEDIVRMDLNESSVSSLLIEAGSVNMFSNKKIIICYNSNFLSASKQISDDETKELTKYLENSFNDVIIIFVCNEEKLDQRKKITKQVIKVSEVTECNKIESFKLSSYLKDYIKNKNYDISSSNIELIISKVGYDLSNLINEVDKLLLYKGDNHSITKEDVEEVITNNIENNVFDLSNAILKKEKEKIMKLYSDLIKIGEDPIKIIIILSNQFRLILQVKLMRKSGYSETEIINTLKEHPYRIKLAMNSNFSIETLKKALLDLSDLDYRIVIGKVDKNFGLEMFLLNI